MQWSEQLCWARFEDGVRLVKIRGESMQAAADARPSAMVSVIGLSADKVHLWPIRQSVGRTWHFPML